MKKFAPALLALATGITLALVTGNYLVQKNTQISANAQWKEIMKTPEGLVDGADLIVVAELEYSVPKTVSYEFEDEVIPMTQNFMAVNTILKGRFAGESLLVEQTGGILTDGMRFNINDGGPYVEGKLYLLFLKDQGNGSYYVINHQARYELNHEKGVLVGVDPSDPVVAVFHEREINQSLYNIEERTRLMEK